MPRPKITDKTKHSIDAARCNLEMAIMLLSDVPGGLEELDITKTFLRDALVSCLRLGLEVELMQDLNERPYLRLIMNENPDF
jgi:hypothetical protein